MTAFLRNFQTRRNPDVRYDLLDELLEALATQEEAEIRTELDRQEEDRDFRLWADSLGLEPCSGCDRPLRRCNCIESQCVACGTYGVWSLSHSVCPGCRTKSHAESPSEPPQILLAS